ncbi:MAG TPA: TonB-dependent receptor plug domain-containing protein, partial [Usitatibacteraceae bacterium]|nr:TonB-dependent receptor plug domain-containing protein [Usitatibacteraceae bacterium]
MRHRFHAPAFAVALCTLSAATAQADPVDLLAAAEPKKLDPLVVTGNPLRDKDFVAPVSVLKDEEMLLRRAGSLGDTLAGLAGVSSTFFGPNSGRPIIRGLDGDRVRILSNFGASFDASSLSFDHSPAIDPLAVERVEVLRGPAALLYGGTAIGGVVNIIDRRVAREPLSGSGAIVEARSGGAERENGLSAALDAGNGLFAIHADGATRETADYAVPSAAGRGKRIVNSAGDSKGGAIGISAAADWGYAGISRSEHRSQYGTVAEPDVRIDMRQSRTAFESEWRPAAGAAFESFSLRAGHTVYRHTEFEGSTAGTIFDSSGSDLRIEARHRALGPLAGVVGVQGDRSRFSALGEEAFVPATESRNRAVFLFEELTTGAIKWSLGLRQEQNRVASSGDTGGGNGRFGVARERRFNPTSASLGATL